MLIVSEKMMVLVVLVVGSLAQDHPGLVEKDSDQDLLAEATISGAQAQKREAGLSNSYGEPLPADVYGPPKDIGNNLISDISLPAPIYGVPEFQNTPTGAYGPPSPVFPNQNYEGPPPPPSKPKLGYGPPKPVYGPPKHSYGPPKQTYGPPKKLYGPPKHGLPKLTYGAPFKPPKLSFPKPVYGVPNSIYGPPKQKYGPPKPVYGLPNATPLLPEVPTLPDLPSINVHQNIPIGSDFGNVNVNVGSNIGFDLPAPIYGTPFLSLPHDMKPNFPLPTETYGPPGQPLGPAGANDQILIQDLGNFHYGPPQPDPNPRPPHPGIPAPPTPPHVLYDGWKPIPGVSKPFGDNEYQHIENQYGPPPPPPPKLNFDLNFDGLTLPNLNPPPQFSGAQINTGYSNVKHDIHHDALANIDLNAIVGGDSNHIDQSKTVFEAHYTEPTVPTGNLIFQSGSSSQFNRPADSYGAPPLESLSNGPYPQSFRSHGAKELPHLSVGHAITAGNHYGPPKQQSSNLPIPYGTFSGGGHSIHTGGSTPRHPIKFREPVPDGLIQQIGHISHHKDLHPNNDHLIQGPAYLPPPIRDAKDVNQHSGNHGLNSISLSIEPSNLYSLPHAGNPINFQNHGQSQPSNLYGSPIDSYSVPLLTVGDHTASGSNTNAVTATIDGTILANLSNLDAAAILKHCPYHEEILKAARTGGKISPELASSYIASLSSLGTAFQKNHQFLNGLNTPLSGNEFYNNKDLSTASQSLVQTVLAGKDYKKELNKGSIVKGKSVKQEQNYDQDDLQLVSQQIFQTSEKIKNLSDETKELQQKIVSSNKNIKGKYSKDISNGKFGGYSVQISPSDGKSNQPSIPHDQLLSEGLLQSILHAIEQPSQAPGQIINDGQQNNYHNINQFTSQSNQGINFGPSSMLDIRNLGSGGIDLPAGYEPVDRTKDKRQEGDQDLQASNKDLRLLLNNEIIQKNKESHTDCDLRADNSIRHVVVVPPPGLGAAETKPVDEVEDNDVAIYFDEPSTNSKEKVEPVTEITVATSISEEIEDTKEEVGFGDKIDKKQS